jgi:hypothetical protein
MASCRGAAVGEERLSVDQPALVVVGRQLQQGGLVTFELSRDGLVLLGVSGRQQLGQPRATQGSDDRLDHIGVQQPGPDGDPPAALMLGRLSAHVPGNAAAFRAGVELEAADTAPADPTDQEVLGRSAGSLLGRRTAFT